MAQIRFVQITIEIDAESAVKIARCIQNAEPEIYEVLSSAYKQGYQTAKEREEYLKQIMQKDTELGMYGLN